MRVAKIFCTVTVTVALAACSSSTPVQTDGGAGRGGSGGGGGTVIIPGGGGGSGGTTGSGGSSGTGGGNGTGGSSGTGGTAGRDDGGDAAGGSAGSSGTVITGSADGTPFTTIGSVLWAGMPDVPSTVVYVFSKPIKCSEITAAGWDTTIPAMTQILEVKMMGTTVGPYQPIIKAPRLPAAGEAQVNYTLSGANPTESFSTSGTTAIVKVTAMSTLSGSFDLLFGANALKGTFEATYCAAGREP
ncbi:MAG TPA: hypothetical protein VFH73_22665 [Polyangia bacterium]|jgi:hypothetical protein|nr:hypothetical protein [Polyangia bacterium]